MRIGLFITILASLGLLGFVSIDFAGVSQWAVQTQRAFQNAIADAVYALQRGDGGALMALLAAAAAYGFVHAIGPGHGKYVIGGVGLGSEISAAKLLSLAVTSSLAQALVAIGLVYGGFLLFQISASQATFLAEDILAPASYIAIALVGAVLVWRGAQTFFKRRAISTHSHSHDHVCSSCGHAHGPSPEQAARVRSLKDAAVVIGSIAIRPCTGAVLLLIIAWQMNIPVAGAIAVIVMGLGTAALTSLVAVSSVAARVMTFASAQSVGVISTIAPAAQIVVGASIAWISLLLLLSGVL